MKYIEVVANKGSFKTIQAIAKKIPAHDLRTLMIDEDDMQVSRLVVSGDNLQSALDDLQSILSSQPKARILVMPVEVSLPKPEKTERSQEDPVVTAREALYQSVEKNARLDFNYFVLVFLSTVVAAIGLIENNVAVVIGAMVIAPLLGPNLALSLGTALGDVHLVKESIVTLLAGICLAVILTVCLGYYWPDDLNSHELMSRTAVGPEAIVLALASGAAAALSLTSGLPSVLVGVMVAVALLPPAATLGLMLGHGDTHFAISAGLLLIVNIVCVNLSSKIVFYIKGVHPRTWLEKKKAKRSMVLYISGWFVALLMLIFVIYMRAVR